MAPAPPPTYPRGHLRRGALLALFLHGQVLVPLLVVAWHRADEEAARRAEEMDVSFEAPDDFKLPDDLPPVDDAPSAQDAEARKREEQKRQKPKPVKAKVTKMAKALEPVPEEPEPEVPMPPMPPMPPPEPQGHRTPVDLDMGQDVEAPADAKYLAQKNNRTDEETRAEDTVLDEAHAGGESSSPSKRTDPQLGDDVTKRIIAESEDAKSALGRRRARAEQAAEQQEEKREAAESLLAMRSSARRDHELSPETASPSLPHEAEGMMPMPRQARGAQAMDAAARADGKRLKLQVTGQDYQRLFGDDAEAERRFASKTASKRVGRFERALERNRAALENFVPEVKAGNQTALNTRAAPFAQYLARMHRDIHKLWGFGVLEDWSTRSSSNPLNRWDLSTNLEIVLLPDGSVDKVTVVRSSGYTPFDAAAIDVVHSAGPYPPPPPVIHSGNGKTYLHWAFNRDERQCHPSGAEPYILANGGERDHAAAQVPSPTSPPESAAAHQRKLERLDRRARSDPRTAARMRELDAEAGSPEPDPGAARHAAALVADPDDPAARAVAERFFVAYVRGDAAAMARQATLPFRSGVGVAAKTRDELVTTFANVLGEATGARALRTLDVTTAAGLRRALPVLPEGFGDATGRLFAVGRAGDATFVLLLARGNDGWRVAGLHRP